MGGLLIDGQIVEVPGTRVIGPHDADWAHLSPGDGRPRTNRPQLAILHKTKADDPERIAPGMGPPSRAERVARFWQEDPAHSGAHLVVSGDCTACLADLVRFEAWHANQANQRSIGIEIYEESHGVVYYATLEAAIRVCLAIAEHCGIQLQIPRLDSYQAGRPLRRFEDGGSTLVGFFGHRDVTDQRNRWDPGELIFEALATGPIDQEGKAEQFDFVLEEDRDVWRDRQRWLNTRGHDLVVDGIAGPKTTAALKAEGYRGGIWALGKA